jgi:hypothetical protein
MQHQVMSHPCPQDTGTQEYDSCRCSKNKADDRVTLHANQKVGLSWVPSQSSSLASAILLGTSIGSSTLQYFLEIVRETIDSGSLQYLRAAMERSTRASAAIPWATIGASPLQQLQMPLSGGRRINIFIPRTTVGSSPMQYCQMAIFSRSGTTFLNDRFRST